MRLLGGIACGLVLQAAALVAQQPAAPSLSITTPEDGSYVSGPFVIRVAVTPFAEVRRVSFFADGRIACDVQLPPFECSWDAGSVVKDHLIRVVATFANGTRLVQNVRTKGVDYAEHVDVDVVQVTATVSDSDGRFVRGLKKESFRVFEDGVPQSVTHFAAQDIPLELVVAVDVSQSMTAAMPQAKAAVAKFLTALRPQDSVTVLAFNDNIFTLARATTDPAARLRAVSRLAPWGGTALYDVIVKSLELLGRQQGRRAVIVFTDGEDQSSSATLQLVEQRVEASDAILYMIGQGRGTRERKLKDILERLARVSGGRAFDTERIEKLEVAFGNIIEELSNQYLLAYPPLNTKRDGSWRRIKVELNDNRHKIRARQGYRAAAGTKE